MLVVKEELQREVEAKLYDDVLIARLPKLSRSLGGDKEAHRAKSPSPAESTKRK